MKKVFIGVGHGGSDPGAVKYLVEKDINLKMAKACRNYLESAGVQVLMSRETDESESLTSKIKECNTYNPDVALDIHNNGGGGDGFEVYHSINPNSKGIVLAKAIEQEVIKIGQNSRGLKTKKNSSGSDYFGFIRETSCPAIITEGVFVDNVADTAQADTDSECNAFGEAYAKGILTYLGVEYVDRGNTDNINGTLYCVQVGAFKDKANAENLAKELNGKGYETYITTK